MPSSKAKQKKAKSSPEKSGSSPTSLADCRKEIDAIDSAIIDFLEARARVAKRIGELKTAQGRDMFDAGRHLEKLNQMAQRGAGDFPAESLRLVFGEILSACLALQARQTV